MADLKVFLTVVDKDTGAVKRVRRNLSDLVEDAGKADSGLGRLQSRFDGLADDWGKVAKLGAGGFVLGAAVAEIGGRIDQATQDASDLAETVSKSRVVFGAFSSDLEAFGETAARSLGQSKQQAMEAAASFGNLFTSSGMAKKEAADLSVNIVKLASDLASFNNLDPGDVLEKLRSGLVGETEPLRVLGVNILESTMKAKALEMGLGGLHGELTEGEKIQARYALIMEQSRNAQGDFARTSDGAANSQRIMDASLKDLSASVGRFFLPAMAAGTRAVADFAIGAEKASENLDLMRSGPVTLGWVGRASKDFDDLGNALERFVEARDRLLGKAQASEYNMFATRDVQAKEDAIRDLIKAYEDWTIDGQDAAGKISQAMIDAAAATTRAWRQSERDFSISMANMEADAVAMSDRVKIAAGNTFMEMQRQAKDAAAEAVRIAAEASDKAQAYGHPEGWGDRPADAGLENARARMDAFIDKQREAAREADRALKDGIAEAAREAGREIGKLQRIYDEFVNAPLKGSRAFEIQSRALQMQERGLQSQLTELEGTRGTGAQRRAIEKQLAELRKQRSLLEDREFLSLQPDRWRLEDLVNPPGQERSFSEIAAGIQWFKPFLPAAEDAMDKENPGLAQALVQAALSGAQERGIKVDVHVDASGQVSVSGSGGSVNWQGMGEAMGEVARVFIDAGRNTKSAPSTNLVASRP